MASIGEILKDPSKATSEDIKFMENMINMLKAFKQKAAPYEGVTMDSGRTMSEISQRVYQENLILYAIMEAFTFQERMSLKELNTWIFKYVDKEFVWDVSIPFCNMCIAKLCKLQLLEVSITNKDDNNPEYIITEKGKEALRQQIFPSLAQSSLYNYQAKKLNIQTLKLNNTIKCLTVGSIIVALAAFTVSLIALLKPANKIYDDELHSIDNNVKQIIEMNSANVLNTTALFDTIRVNQ
jgi:hypothetical protein